MKKNRKWQPAHIPSQKTKNKICMTKLQTTRPDKKMKIITIIKLIFEIMWLSDAWQNNKQTNKQPMCCFF